jgi:hypothetical protein
MWQRLLVGATFTATGAFIMAVGAGIVPVDPETIHAPMWIIAMAGLVFVLGGVMMLAGWLEQEGATPVGTPVTTNPIPHILVLAIMLCMAAMATWATFAEGEIEGGIALPFVSYDSEINQYLGRALFGFGALLCWAVVAAAAFHAWRQRFNKPK